MLNNKGMSMLGFLIAVTLIMTLMMIILQNYHKNLTQMAGPNGTASMVKEISAVKQNIQKAAEQHGNLESQLYR